MFWRIFSFILSLLLGSLAGWWLGAEPGAWAGAALGGLSWFVIDLLRGLRVLRWLRRADSHQAPQMTGLWGEIADRTRRQLRSREADTSESQARLQEFLEALQASPNGVVLLDPQGRIEWCNQTAAQQFGFDAQRDLQQHIGNLVRDPSFTAYFAGNDYRSEVIMPGRENTVARPVKLSVNLHPYGRGRKLLLARDVTAVEQAEVMRRDFVANVSHEIRTPLTVLSGFVETLQTLSLNEAERARYLALMAQQSQRMQTLVNDLLTLSRLEGSPLPGSAEWTPLQTLMVECEHEARALSTVLTQSSHVIGFTVEGEPVRLAGAHGELLSAMSNLTSNAIRYTPAGGRIDVRWQMLPDGRGEYSVHDSGPGIAAEHLSRLTERFYRVDRSRSRETGGTGLGLAIVKHVVQRHGGELRIESTLGSGSTFSIVFPAARIEPV
jgi:two-component system phosphate regulon sensor histidine kinase PhoR